MSCVVAHARRQLVAQPLQAQTRALRDAHHVPLVAHRVAEGVDAARRIVGHFSMCANTTPEVPSVQETMPASTMPLPTALAAWSPPPPATGVPSASPVSAAARGVMVPVTSLDS